MSFFSDTLCRLYFLHIVSSSLPCKLLYPSGHLTSEHTIANFPAMHTQRMSDTHGISKANRPRLRLVERRMPLKDRNPELALKLKQMRLTIAPILHVTSGKPAPDYPYTMLDLFLLTEDQLDALAHYYSQVTPGDLTHEYPQTMKWDQPFLDKDPGLPTNCKLNDLERLKIKMRMFARFIGMRGAETPIWEYERQVQILGNKIEQSVQEEENVKKKFYRGPTTKPP